jgi:hypothetical protein
LKTTKLVTGVLSIVLTLMVLFQSCAAGLYNTMTNTGESSGMAGLMVSILMIAGGITMIATRNSRKNGGSIACFIIFLLAAMIGFSMAGTFADLKVWASWCLVMVVLNFISVIKKDPSDKTNG